jgi:hypothetical protein
VGNDHGKGRETSAEGDLSRFTAIPSAEIDGRSSLPVVWRGRAGQGTRPVVVWAVPSAGWRSLLIDGLQPDWPWPLPDWEFGDRVFPFSVVLGDMAHRSMPWRGQQDVRGIRHARDLHQSIALASWVLERLTDRHGDGGRGGVIADKARSTMVVRRSKCGEVHCWNTHTSTTTQANLPKKCKDAPTPQSGLPEKCNQKPDGNQVSDCNRGNF